MKKKTTYRKYKKGGPLGGGRGVPPKKPQNDYWNTDPDVLKFRETFRNRFGEEPSRDAKIAKYDYDKAYKAGVRPVLDASDGLYHWASEYKHDDHPNRFVDGVDTKKPISPFLDPSQQTTTKNTSNDTPHSNSKQFNPPPVHKATVEELIHRAVQDKSYFRQASPESQKEPAHPGHGFYYDYSTGRRVLKEKPPWNLERVLRKFGDEGLKFLDKTDIGGQFWDAAAKTFGDPNNHYHKKTEGNDLMRLVFSLGIPIGTASQVRHLSKIKGLGLSTPVRNLYTPITSATAATSAVSAGRASLNNTSGNYANKAASSVDDVGKGLTQVPQAPKAAWQMQELPGLHLKSTLPDNPKGIHSNIRKADGTIDTKTVLDQMKKIEGDARYAEWEKGFKDVYGEGLENLPKRMDYNDFIKTGQKNLIELEHLRGPEINRGFLEKRISYGGYEPELDLLDYETVALGNKSKFGRGVPEHDLPEEALGHLQVMRTKESPDVLNALGIQADAFQGTHRIMPKTFDKEQQLRSLAHMEDIAKRQEASWKNAVQQPDGSWKYPDRNETLVSDYLHRQGNPANMQRNANAMKQAEIENFTQKQLLDKNHPERFLQELVDYAGKRGDVNKVRVPTSETAAKVQGYSAKKTWNTGHLQNGDEVVLADGTVGKVTDDVFDNRIGITTNDGRKINIDMGTAGYGPSKQPPVKSVNNIDVKESALFAPQHQTILKKYSDYGSSVGKDGKKKKGMIENLFGQEPKIVTDSKGNTWYEFDIPDKAKKGKMQIKALTTTGAAIGTGAALQGGADEGQEPQQFQYGGPLNRKNVYTRTPGTGYMPKDFPIPPYLDTVFEDYYKAEPGYVEGHGIVRGNDGWPRGYGKDTSDSKPRLQIPSLNFSHSTYETTLKNKRQVRKQTQPLENKWDNGFYRNWAIGAGYGHTSLMDYGNFKFGEVEDRNGILAPRPGHDLGRGDDPSPDSVPSRGPVGNYHNAQRFAPGKGLTFLQDMYQHQMLAGKDEKQAWKDAKRIERKVSKGKGFEFQYGGPIMRYGGNIQSTDPPKKKPSSFATGLLEKVVTAEYSSLKPKTSGASRGINQDLLTSVKDIVKDHGTKEELRDYSASVNSRTAKIFREQIIDQDYKYGMNTSSYPEVQEAGQTGKGLEGENYIDCSGSVCKVLNELGVNRGDPTVYNSAWHFHNDSKPVDEKNWRDGDLITMKVGKGIDHIGFLVIDSKTGKKYIAESSSSFGKGTITPFDLRIKQLQDRSSTFEYHVRRLPEQETTSTTQSAPDTVSNAFEIFDMTKGKYPGATKRLKYGGELPEYALGALLKTAGKLGTKVLPEIGMLGDMFGGKFGQILGDIGTGASFGSLFPGAGTLIGAGAGLVRGLLRKKPEGDSGETAIFDSPESRFPPLRAMPTRGVSSSYFEDGGFLNPEYEVERGEVIKGMDTIVEDGGRVASDITKVGGLPHSMGGTKGKGGEKVYSDKIFVSPDVAKMFMI